MSKVVLAIRRLTNRLLLLMVTELLLAFLLMGTDHPRSFCLCTSLPALLLLQTYLGVKQEQMKGPQPLHTCLPACLPAASKQTKKQTAGCASYVPFCIHWSPWNSEARQSLKAR